MKFTQSLNYEVSKKPLYVSIGDEMIPCTDKVAIINDGTNKVLSYMHPRYRLFTNKEFMELCQHIGDTFNIKVDHYNSYKGGKKVLCAFSKMEGKHSICGFEFKDHMVIYDSRDGTLCLGGAGVGTLHRCDNLFGSASMASGFKFKHISSLDQKLAEFQLGLELHAVGREEKIERLESIQQKSVTTDDLYRLIGGWVKLTPDEVADVAYGTHKGQEISTKKANIVNGLMNSWYTESRSLSNNGFALWNAVTHYYTHNRKKGAADILFADFGKKEEAAIKFAEAL